MQASEKPCMGLQKSSACFQGISLFLFFFSVSLFDLGARFFVPTRNSRTLSRTGTVKVGRRASLSLHTAASRPCLDSPELDGTLDLAG